MTPFFSRNRRERELEDEIQAHVDMAVAERVARGESRVDAERAVRREFGDPGRVKEVTRTMWGGMWLDRLEQDLRFGFRSLFRDRGFSLAATLVLVVGIGANAIVFTLAHRVLFEDPPGVGSADELVGLQWLNENGDESSWSYTDFKFVREENGVFSDVFAYTGFPLTAAVRWDDSPPSPADGWVVSHNFFQALGTGLALGRGFLPEEGVTPGTHPVVVLDHAFWQREFGADSAILTRTIALNGTPFIVVGVTEADFRGITPIDVSPDFYVPVTMQGALAAGWEEMLERRPGESNSWLKVIARLGAEASLESARSDMDVLAFAWQEEFGDWARSNDVAGVRMEVSSDPGFSPGEAERLHRTIWLLGIVAGAVLFIGCANLVILLLARGSAREGEIGVRAALGAGRGRLLRQLLTESALLAGVACVAGLALAYWGAGIVARLLPFYFAADMTPDGLVLLGTVAVTLIMTAVFGLAPALKLSSTDLGTTLRRQLRNTRRSPARSALVVGQIAASVVLVAGAGLFVRSVLAARSVELGFDPENRVLMSVQLGTHGYDAEGVQLFQRGVLERIRALPGVVSAALTDRGPFSGRSTSNFRPIGTEYEEEGLNLSMNRVGAGYFETMGVQVVAGRPITEVDDGYAVRSLVISRTAAERLFPGESGVGRIFRWRDDEWTVVGVAEDAKYYSLGEEPVSRVYVPQARVDDGNLTFVARTAVPPAGLVSAIEGAIHEVDPAVAVFGVQTLQDLVDGQTNSYRSMAVLVSAFGLVALILAAVGLYGVQAYVVGQRSKEIGIRIAMGARAGEVASSILGRGAVLSLVGVSIGVAVAFGLGRIVEGMLFGVEPQDPVTFVGVAALLLAVALAASYFPARRAGRLDPMMVLKEE